ncbi:AAA family ATPase [Microcoleus sp. D2_18a_B4]|uniref:AAA family ATPase n=1 Tax=Microcoleus sp. D2_18a_B4 TaxID=3055329 RepID=UPI002FCFDEA7
MEQVFVHPESPFSVNTFNLLAQFNETPTSDFYREHKKDFLQYVEVPLKYILSQVEEQLPDFIKKYIDIKQESFGSIQTQSLKSTVVYSVDYCFNGRANSRQSDKLMLTVENQTLTFGFSGNNHFFPPMVNCYKDYANNVNLIEILKRYHLPHRHSFSYSCLTTNDFGERLKRIMKPEKSIHKLLESMLSEINSYPNSELERLRGFDVQVAISLESEEILRYSAKHLIQKIAQTFKKLFPLLLIFNLTGANNNPELLLSQYFSVYEKEFNPEYQIEKISEITGFQTTQLTQWIHAINRKGQTIIQGPPGTGKTFIAEKLAKHLIGGGDGFSDIIQFHPAYTYEDFLEGLRPITQNGQLTYSIVPGRFLEFCKQAEACEDTCVLIIDEINRANLSQVFGELMYLLDDRQDTGRSIILASGKQFRIPTNVRIIGTMNTADRSIALVDNALRRRFAFIPVYPNYEVLRQYHHREETGFPVDKLTSILEDVNRAINNKHYELGISFFLTKTLAEDIQDIWQMEIEPYLEEYFFDNQAKMDEFLWDKIKYQFSNLSSNATIITTNTALQHL